MESTERKVLWTASLTHGLIHVYELSVPILLIPIQAEFGAGDFQMGSIVALYGLLFGLGSLPAGFLVDRVGSKRLLLVCLWGGALSMIGMAASPTLAWFTVCAACMGACISIYHPAGTSLITHSIRLSGSVFATHGMLGNLGVAGSGVIAGTLGALFGWRWALVFLASLGVVLALKAMQLPVLSLHDVRSRQGRGNWAAFVMLLLAAAFMGMVYRGMTTFLPKFFAVRFVEGDGAATAVGGLLTTAALMIGVLGMYAAGRAIDRGVRPSLAFLVGAACQAPFLVGLGHVGTPLLVPMAMGVAFFHFFTQPSANHMVADFTPPRLRGLGYGLYFFLAFGTGSLGASVGGWVSENMGLADTFPVLAVILVPSVLAAALLVPVAKKGTDLFSRWPGK